MPFPLPSFTHPFPYLFLPSFNFKVHARTTIAPPKEKGPAGRGVLKLKLKHAVGAPIDPSHNAYYLRGAVARNEARALAGAGG
jgi:hypothetical protein